MNIYRDIGKVLLKLDDNYYEKGIKKISVSLNGIRSEKIPHMSRRVIIPQLIRSKECDKFIQQFIENLREEINNFINEDYIKAIIENPSENKKIEKISETNKQLFRKCKSLLLIQISNIKECELIQFLRFRHCLEKHILVIILLEHMMIKNRLLELAMIRFRLYFMKFRRIIC